MSLFDVDELDPKVARPSRRTTSKPRPKKPEAPVLDGLEKPYEAPPVIRPPLPGRIEDVAQRIANGEMGGRFRCDAVTHTLVLMLYRQFELSFPVPDGRLCHPGMTDAELTEAFEDGIHCLRSIHGADLFPEQPVWEPEHLRRWTQLWHGVDLIGRWGDLDFDVISLVFQHSANMTGKQNAWGAFYTPWHVTKLMATATLDLDERPWARSVCDPCSGAGSMLVAAWEITRQRLLTLQRDRHITNDESQRLALRFGSRLTAIDIDGEAAWATAAQLATRTGVRAQVWHGSALGDLTELVPARHPHRFIADVEPSFESERIAS